MFSHVSVNVAGDQLTGGSSICAFDYEYNQIVRTPRIPDFADLLEASRDDNPRRSYIERHEAFHILFRSFVRNLPNAFDEGFAKAMAGLHTWDAQGDVLCIHPASNQNELFWRRMCTQYGLTDARIGWVFGTLAQQSALSGRLLTHEEFFSLTASWLSLSQEKRDALRVEMRAQGLAL